MAYDSLNYIFKGEGNLQVIVQNGGFGHSMNPTFKLLSFISGNSFY